MRKTTSSPVEGLQEGDSLSGCFTAGHLRRGRLAGIDLELRNEFEQVIFTEAHCS
jgi:hypothetical protein